MGNPLGAISDMGPYLIGVIFAVWMQAKSLIALVLALGLGFRFAVGWLRSWSGR